MASEDFGVLGLEQHEMPTVMFRLGALGPAKLANASAQGKSLPPHACESLRARSRTDDSNPRERDYVSRDRAIAAMKLPAP